MSYTEALERLKKLSGSPDQAVTKVTKPPFGTYGTPSPGVSEKLNPFGTDNTSGNKALSEPLFSKSEKSQTPRGASAKSAESPQVVALVHCRDCRNFEPDQVNPPAGMGSCKVDADGDPASPGYRAPWPTLPRRCQSFEIARAAVFRECKAACKSLQVDPSELCDWLINQADPGWLVPAAIRRLAQIIDERGYPDE